MGQRHQRAALDGFARDEAVQIDEENQAAIGRDGGAGKKLYIAEVLAQVLDHDFIFADDFFDDHADLASADVDKNETVISVDGFHRGKRELRIETNNFSDHIA